MGDGGRLPVSDGTTGHKQLSETQRFFNTALVFFVWTAITSAVVMTCVTVLRFFIPDMQFLDLVPAAFLFFNLLALFGLLPSATNRQKWHVLAFLVCATVLLITPRFEDEVDAIRFRIHRADFEECIEWIRSHHCDDLVDVESRMRCLQEFRTRFAGLKVHSYRFEVDGILIYHQKRTLLTAERGFLLDHGPDSLLVQRLDDTRVHRIADRWYVFSRISD